MHTPQFCFILVGGGGKLKNFRKIFAGEGVGSENFILVGGGVILLEGSHNYKVKVKTA